MNVTTGFIRNIYRGKPNGRMIATLCDEIDRLEALLEGAGAAAQEADPEDPDPSPETRCTDFRKGRPSGLCEGDGHYRCSECSERTSEEPGRDEQ